MADLLSPIEAPSGATTVEARLLERVRGGPDPEAEVRLLRFLDAAAAEPGGVAACVTGPDAEAVLVLLLGQSPALARELVRRPSSLAELAASPFLRREKPAERFATECAECLGATSDSAESDDPFRALRRYRTREYLRLGARELGYGTGQEVGRELAALASACLHGAVQVARREQEAKSGPALLHEAEGVAAGTRCRFVAMGMGKLGGQELNFSSDIDLIYLYESDVGAAVKGATTTSLHEFFARVAERATRLVSDATDDGSCFRIDLRLRPEGSRGPLVNSLDAAERYYESWGKPWERQAWIKARPVAGDLTLGEEVLGRLEPMVWPRAGVASAIEDVQALMRRVRAELRDADDVKLGRGGIREIEFFTQALQLVHGGRRRELRERGTLRALDRLLFAGLVSERERRQLGDAYVFLRRVEHRLQLVELRQTHALPRTPEERALLGRRLGYPGEPALWAQLAAQRDAVAAIYATLGASSTATEVLGGEGGHGAAVAALLDPTTDRAALEEAFGALGFRDHGACADELELLRRKPLSPFSPTAAGASARAAPRLLVEAAASPDPDLALRRMVDLAVRGAPASVVWRLCGESEPIARLLASLFGTSEFLSKILVARPELCELLLTSAGARGPALPDTAWHAAAIGKRLAELARRSVDTGAADAADAAVRDTAAPDEEEQLDALRRYRNEELLRLGLLDVGGALDREALGGSLTALAEALIDTTLAIVRPAVEARWGRAATDIAVVGLGKLGGGEMTWSSDLDIIFVFGDEEAEVVGGRGGASAFEVMSRLAQRLLHGLSAQLPSGRLYEVDTRLRPSGRQGALVSSLAGLQRYHEQQAALWERQALVKARVVAGDPGLGARVEEAFARFLWQRPAAWSDPTSGPAGWTEEVRREVARMRARQEKELAPREGRYNVKTGRGGLVDIEYLVQCLQLAHGPDHPAVRVRSTAAALDALRAEELLPQAEHAELAEALRFLRRLESRMRIVEDRPRAELSSEDPAGLEKLARRLGYHGGKPGARLLADYLTRADRVRAIYERHLGASTAG